MDRPGRASEKQSPARLADVAALAGVSSATASRALAGSSHRVSKETQGRIEAAARELGYRVNPIARALRLSATGSIGMVVPSIGNPFFTELVEEVEALLAGRKLNLYLCSAQDDPAIEARRLRALSGSVDGILIAPAHPETSLPAVAAAAELVPVVQLDRRLTDLDLPWVGVTDAEAIRAVMEHLQSLGARSVAMLTNSRASLSAATRTAAIRAEADRLGIDLRDENVFESEFSLASGATAVHTLLSRNAMPAAIVCVDDLLAIGALSALREEGIRVPQDVRVTGFDDIQFSSLVSPAITTVRQPLDLMAAKAVELLLDGGALPNARITIAAELQIRGSTVAEEIQTSHQSPERD